MVILKKYDFNDFNRRDFRQCAKSAKKAKKRPSSQDLVRRKNSRCPPEVIMICKIVDNGS